MEARQSVRRTYLVDVTVFVTIAVLLTLLHFFLPTATQERLVFHFHDPSLHTTWTAALLHSDALHLFSNILGYLIGIIATYYFYCHLEQRRRFWITTGVIFIAIPPVTSAVDFGLLHLHWGLMAEGATSRGFSGIVNGFGGMLLATIGLFLVEKHDIYRAINASTSIMLVGFGLIAHAMGILTPSMMILLIVGGIACGSGLVPREVLVNPARRREVVEVNSRTIVDTAVAGLFVCAFMLTFVPAGTEGGTFSNVIAHATGFAFGLVSTLLISWISPL